MASLTPLSKGLIALAVVGAMASAVWHLGLKERLGGATPPAQSPPANASVPAPPATPAPPPDTEHQPIDKHRHASQCAGSGHASSKPPGHARPAPRAQGAGLRPVAG